MASASITSIIRLKYVLKYANTYDSTWDNVSLIKWSVIEILSACICCNLMPLRPLFERLLPTVRSIFSFRSRYSGKSSNQDSRSTHVSWGNPVRRPAPTPNLISTAHTMKADVYPGWDWKTGDESEMVTPKTPAPAYYTKSFDPYGRDTEESILGLDSDKARGTTGASCSTPENTNHQTMSAGDKNQTGTLLDSTRHPTLEVEGRTSRSSGAGLISPDRTQEQRHSGSWSRVLSVMYRK